MATYIEEPIVTDNFRKEVLKCLGYPLVDEDTIYDLYAKENIDTLIIANGMEKFYNYFPIVREYEFPASTVESTIDSPIENVLGVIHYGLIKITNGSFGGASGMGNMFSYAYQMSLGQGYGTPFRYGSTTYTIYQSKFLQDSQQKLAGGNHYYCKYNEDTNSFTFRSATGQGIHALIGCYSNDVNDIPKSKKQHLIDYCKGLLMVEFARTLSLNNGDLPLDIDKDTLLDEGNEMLDREVEWFERNSTIALER